MVQSTLRAAVSFGGLLIGGECLNSSCSTLPKTNSKSPWKWMVGIRSFSFGARPIFRGELAVSFRECSKNANENWRESSQDSWEIARFSLESVDWLNGNQFGDKTVVVKLGQEKKGNSCFLWPWLAGKSAFKFKELQKEMYFPYHPCMVYLSTFGWFVLYM